MWNGCHECQRRETNGVRERKVGVDEPLCSASEDEDSEEWAPDQIHVLQHVFISGWIQLDDAEIL